MRPTLANASTQAGPTRTVCMLRTLLWRAEKTLKSTNWRGCKMRKKISQEKVCKGFSILIWNLHQIADQTNLEQWCILNRFGRHGTRPKFYAQLHSKFCLCQIFVWPSFFQKSFLCTCYVLILVNITGVRLVNKRGEVDKEAGRVEVFYAGIWGVILDDGWDKKEAKVVCRMLGYEDASLYVKRSAQNWKYTHSNKQRVRLVFFLMLHRWKVIAYTRSYFGNGKGPAWLSDLECTGYEENIGHCARSKRGFRHSKSRTKRNHASVDCTGVGKNSFLAAPRVDSLLQRFSWI